MATTQEILNALDDLTQSHQEARFQARSLLIKTYKQLQAENGRLTNALERLSRWAKAYPLSMFPEPNFVIAREVLEEHGISLDSVSASNMRHVIKGVSDIVEQVLKEK